MKSLVWFRRDLRVLDNSALRHAIEQSTDGVVGLYILTPQQWIQHDDAACKVKFWLDNLSELSASLATRGISLHIETVDTFDDVPECIIQTAESCKCAAVYVNREYEYNEMRRDHNVFARCVENGIEFHGFHDRLIVPPNEVLTKEGKACNLCSLSNEV